MTSKPFSPSTGNRFRARPINFWTKLLTKVKPDRLGRSLKYLLQVVGDSMIDAAICDGDWVVVRAQATAENGEIVAALLDDEATVKTFRQRDGHTWLLPQNSQYEPILGDHATVMGKVVSVLRSL